MPQKRFSYTILKMIFKQFNFIFTSIMRNKSLSITQKITLIILIYTSAFGLLLYIIIKLIPMLSTYIQHTY